MSWYRVTGDRRGRIPAPYVLAALVAGLVLMGAAYRVFLTVPVTVEGAQARLLAGTRVSDLGDRLHPGKPGDLVAAKDKKVLRPGGGESPYVVVNGKRATADLRLQAGDDVRSMDGSDSVEPLASRQEQVKAPVRYEGEGSLETVEQKGAPGLREVTFGSISKQVVATREVRKPVARLVRRSDPHPGAKVVALTFDDGPWPGQTEAVLGVLQKYGVKATFFQVGSQAKGRPGLSKKLADAGMMLANHTQTHTSLTKCDAARTRREIAQAQANIEKASGQRPRFFRPPGGATTEAMWPVLEDLGLRLVQWDIDTKDWRKPGAGAITSNVLSHVRPGAVVLMHDGGGDRSQTIQALPGIIEGLKAKGYSFVTLDEIGDLPKRMG